MLDMSVSVNPDVRFALASGHAFKRAEYEGKMTALAAEASGVKTPSIFAAMRRG